MLRALPGSAAGRPEGRAPRNPTNRRGTTYVHEVFALLGCEGEALGPVALPPDPELGREIFRFDDFGNWRFWTDTLRLHELVERVTPRTALALGLKVDADAVPAEVLNAVGSDPSLLDDPAVSRALLSLGAVVGVVAQVEGERITRIGITCALCHSTVDDAVAPGIGRRRDGWPNRDLASTSTGRAARSSSRRRTGCATSRSRPTRARGRFRTGTTTWPSPRCTAAALSATSASASGSTCRPIPTRSGASCRPSASTSTAWKRPHRRRARSIPRPPCGAGSCSKVRRAAPGVTRAATLRDVVDHYDRVLGLRLTEQQKADLVEYLKSL
jgi:hypothetical protein